MTLVTLKPFSWSLYDPGDLENLVKVTKILSYCKVPPMMCLCQLVKIWLLFKKIDC